MSGGRSSPIAERDRVAEKPNLARVLWGINLAVIGVFAFLAASRFWRGAGFGDFHVFHDAFLAVFSGENIYESGVKGYIYPPLFAVLFAPLGLLSREHAGAVFAVINAGLVLLCLWLSASEVIRRFRARDSAATLPAVMLVALAVFGDKLRIELSLGQTDMLILACLLLALRWLDRRPILAGVMLGLAGNLKYQSLVVLPYLIIRRRWSALLGTLGSLIGFALSSAIVFGWERNTAYLARAFGGLGRMVGVDAGSDAARVQSITWIRSVSFTSVFARLQEWAGWPGFVMLGLVGVTALACLGVVMLLYRHSGHAVFMGRSGTSDAARPAGPALVYLEWTGLLVAVLVFGPQTNARHMVLMIPLATLAGVLMLVPRPGIGRLPVLASTVFLVLAFILPPGTGDDNSAVHAWRWIGGISIAATTLLFVGLAGGLKWAQGLPAARSS